MLQKLAVYSCQIDLMLVIIQNPINKQTVVDARNMAKEFEVGIVVLEVYNHSHDIEADECALAFHKYLLQDRVKFLSVFFRILAGK